MFLGIEHVTLTATHPETLAEWYCRVLGFSTAYRSGGVIFLKHPAGGSMIEMLKGEGGVNDMTTANQGAALFGILVNDVPVAVSDLKARGVELVDEPMEDEFAVVQFFKDGEGNLLHLISRR